MATIARPNVGATITDPPSAIRLLLFESRHHQQAVLQAVCDVFRYSSCSEATQERKDICKTTNVECWLHDEDVQLEQSEQLELEGRLEVEVSVQVEEVVDVEAVQTATRRNVFDLFDNLFEECTE